MMLFFYLVMGIFALAGVIHALTSPESKKAWRQAQYDVRIKQATRVSRRKLQKLTREARETFDLCAYAEELARQCGIRINTALRAAEDAGFLEYKAMGIYREVAPALRERPYRNFSEEYVAELADRYKIPCRTVQTVLLQFGWIYQHAASCLERRNSRTMEDEYQREQRAICAFVEKELQKGTIYPIWNWGDKEEDASAYRAAASNGMHPRMAFSLIAEELERRRLPLTKLS